MCKALGGGDDIVAALRDALPDASNYTFQDTDKVRSDPRNSSFNSDCSVWVDGKTALVTSAEMMRSDPPELWREGVVADNESLSAGQARDFSAGDSALSGDSFAAIYVPCVPSGTIPGGNYSLSVQVRAVQRSAAPADAAQQSLVKLVLSAAEHAHKQAKCDLPSKLPSEVPVISPASG